MSDRTPIPLDPLPIDVDSVEFRAISGWPYADPFVGRLLRDDVPQRVRFNRGRVWVYRDPGGRLVGFGSLDVCGEYKDYTGGRPHLYIPLLAVNPTIESLGYGTSIVRHLIGEAALIAYPGGCDNTIFLDVYTTSERAIRLYKKCGFVPLTDEPTPDPLEGGKTYLVMARRVAIERPPLHA